MLKRPSSRRKSHSEGIELNLVPILDTMVTLIGFLLFTTSFLAIVSIESPLPQASSEEVQEKLKEKPLQLTVTIKEGEVEIWSPFNKIPTKTFKNIPAIPTSTNPAPSSEGNYDLKGIHEALMAIKKDFPTEQNVVLAPMRNTGYEGMVGLMDALRTIDPTDPPLYLKNAQTGLDEPAKVLFPKVVFGNLLGDQ